ncbi:hypothetical protein [Solitalea koreensis]|uniref:Tetratricopeptide repeat-containing protein n=1 Tax=Solitalea koreensis TaxID=543615 RepID=A0A521AZB8_9SPHI|nr:hypothetical protein [Solitalea koreensis]SMO40139.1 hypothetical protein SAMN06265350_101542 [Solitalea koreensis]
MNKELFHKYLNEARRQNFSADSDLKQAIAKYSYCATLHFLLAKSYRNQNSVINYPVAQGIAAAYASNREALYEFIYPQPEFEEEVVAKVPAVEEAPFNTFAANFRNKMAQLEAENPLKEDAEEDTFSEETDDIVSIEDDSASDFGAFTLAHQLEVVDIDIEESNDPISAIEEPVEGSNELIKFNPLATGVALNIDDHLPHTFTFWLRRIRQLQEPANAQQVITEPIKKVVTQNFTKGFIENALHVSTFNELEDKVIVEFDLSKKEDRLIEKFIREEPTIRAVQLNEISFEDKAEKHTEDDMSLVTETMAKVYSDQHLYEKAIIVYEKLSLKFPEKKLYFATQIEKLRQLGQV